MMLQKYNTKHTATCFKRSPKTQVAHSLFSFMPVFRLMNHKVATHFTKTQLENAIWQTVSSLSDESQSRNTQRLHENAARKRS